MVQQQAGFPCSHEQFNLPTRGLGSRKGCKTKSEGSKFMTKLLRKGEIIFVPLKMLFFGTILFLKKQIY